MKRKILLNGRSQNLVSDFFQNTEAIFDTLSTTTIWSDIIGHFQFFQPNAYLVFIENNLDQTIQQLKDLREHHFYNGAAIVVVGDAESCSMLERRARSSADLIIRRPVTSDNLALRINSYLDDAGRTKTGQATIREKASQMDALIKAAEAALSDVDVDSITSGPAAASGAAASGAAAASNVRKHILVVDDDRTILKMIKSALEAKYDITAMANGAMVDKVLAAKKVDLIVLDYEMPIETGADIFKRIKKNPRLANIPVCFLTGVSDKEKIMDVMSLKPHGYILKPIDMDALSSTIKGIIG